MLVYLAIILIVLLGFCGLAIDVGRMELRTNQLQAAADAGALAAAGELWHSSTTTNGQAVMQAAADADISTYETANGIASTKPSAVQLGASTGPYTGDDSTVQVTVTQSFPTIFMGLLSSGNKTVTLTARAVAQMPPCLIFLGTPTYSSTYDFWVTSSGVNTVQDYWTCPLYTRHGTLVDYFSHYDNSQTRSSGAATASSFGSTTTPPIYNVPVIADPLAWVPLPSAALPCSAAHTTVSYLSQATGTTIQFVPGTYCGKTAAYTPGPTGCTSSIAITPAIDVEGTYTSQNGGFGCPSQSFTNGGNCRSNPTVNFAPGLYVFIGGINLTCVTVTGNGVTMYFTRSSTVGFSQMFLTGTIWNVNAPTTTDTTSGQIAGISVMNDPAWTASTPGNNDDFQWRYSTWNGDGVVYLRGTGIFDFSMPMSAPNYLNIVAANMYSYLGEMHPATNYASLPAGNPLRTVITLVQ